jgi:hypothetical protein
MFRTAAGGITHGSTAHFKEPFLHILYVWKREGHV